MNNIEKLKAVPDSLLNTVPGETITSPIEPPPGITEVSKQDVFDTAKTAEITPDSLFSVPPSSPNTAAAAGSAKTTSTGTNTTVNTSAGSIVSGTFAVGLMDSIIPAVLLLAANAMGYELDKKGITLTEKEKATISPAMQAYLDSININFNNPLYNLLFVVAAVYGSKIVEQLPNIKRKEKAVRKPVTPIEAAEIKAKESMSREAERVKELEAIRQMSREAGIKYIADKRKLSRVKAVEWYNKNIA